MFARKAASRLRIDVFSPLLQLTELNAQLEARLVAERANEAKLRHRVAELTAERDALAAESDRAKEAGKAAERAREELDMARADVTRLEAMVEALKRDLAAREAHGKRVQELEDELEREREKVRWRV